MAADKRQLSSSCSRARIVILPDPILETWAQSRNIYDKFMIEHRAVGNSRLDQNRNEIEANINTTKTTWMN
jgi:hypothetical protein